MTECQASPALACEPKCDPPQCEVRCPVEHCESGNCPECTTVCKKPRCHNVCQAAKVRNWRCAGNFHRRSAADGDAGWLLGGSYLRWQQMHGSESVHSLLGCSWRPPRNSTGVALPLRPFSRAADFNCSSASPSLSPRACACCVLTHLLQAPECTSSCEKPKCAWRCRKPDICPRPKCKLQCEQRVGCPEPSHDAALHSAGPAPAHAHAPAHAGF